MTEFELLVIPLSVLLGVGAARMLEGVVHAIRHRKRVQLHWMPIAWGGFIFMYVITFFSTLWNINQQHEGVWTWPLFGMQLIVALLLFLSAGLILARDETALEFDMRSGFEEHGRLALIPFAILFALAIPFNKWGEGPDWISPQNLLNVILLGLILAVFRTPESRLQQAGTVMFGIVSVVGWFVFFAHPGS